MESTGSVEAGQLAGTDQRPSQHNSTRGNKPRGRHRGRTGRGGTNSRFHNVAVGENTRSTFPVQNTASATPSNVPMQMNPPAANQHTAGRARSHRGRNETNVEASNRGNARRGRGSGNIGATHSHANQNRNTFQTGSRGFGSQLTTVDQPAPVDPPNSGLHAEAAEFTPGQVHQQRVDQPGQGRTRGSANQRSTKHKRRDSSLRSTANDIASRTHEDIANGLYECSICTSEITRSSKVWSCKTCWTVFHLGCIKQWSKNEGSSVAQPRRTDEERLPRQWRCPGCNLPKDELPSVYTCWCEKESSPGIIPGVPPHSCGQTCAKPRSIPKECPHPCELTCHAGPCPPCSHMGPIQSCFCGKSSSSRRCIDTNYENGWSCGEICGDQMPCGEHTCARLCHEGLCGACEVVVDASCYCGKIARPIVCNEKEDERHSEKSELTGDNGNRTLRSWTGVFDCGDTCGREYDCGKHICEKSCHAQDAEPSHCPFSPDVVSNCPCGKTFLENLSDVRRTTCEDQILNCGEECSKVLACGHTCQMICHSGVCPPCTRKIEINCRCGRVQVPGICHQDTGESPLCTRVCKATLNCGRHDCGEHCCPGEKKATERLAIKRKLRPLNGSNAYLQEGFEAEHICMRVCDRPLKCGNHHCPELCHKGPCGSCREAIFDEISCHCGRTVIQPPLPCGTGPPSCRYDCDRVKTCGHPQIQHNCHGDQENCPKCPYLLEKPCMCGKKTLKNQPCFLADIRCGEVCGKKLRCGSHYCLKFCHRSGDCEDTSSHCHQPCGKPKKSCGHPCEDRCHSPSSCKEDKPCTSKLIITCECQNLKAETKCQASRSSEGNIKKSLKCDDECARLERNRRLALALNVDPETHQDDHIPYSSETLQLYQDSTKWAQSQEREMRVFAADDTAKRLRYKPMPSHQRSFIHALADDFGFDSESLDPEPHRHICVFKTPRFVKAPMKTLADCARIRASNGVATTGSLAAAVSATSSVQQKLLADNNPYNGFILTGLRFGLTVDELRTDLSLTFAALPTLIFDIEFLPSEEIVLKARPSSPTTTITPLALETALKSFRASLSAAVVAKKLAASLGLCALDPSLNILRKEADAGSSAAGGWSHVAAKGASPRMAPKREGFGAKSSFVILGKKKSAAATKKEEEKEGIVEDWEEEMRKEEEEEGKETRGKESEHAKGSDEGNDGAMEDETNEEMKAAA